MGVGSEASVRSADLDSLPLRAAHGVASVLVEAGQERLVVGELHQARLPDLHRARVPPESCEQGRRRGIGLDARLELGGDHAAAAADLAQADRHGAQPLGRTGIGVVEDRAVGHIPERASQRQATLLGGHQRHDIPLLLDHEAPLRLTVECGHRGPRPIVQEVTGVGAAQECLPRPLIFVACRPKSGHAALDRAPREK